MLSSAVIYINVSVQVVICRSYNKCAVVALKA